MHRDRCISSGQCAWNVPAVFDQSEEDGLVELRMAEPPAEAREALRTAARLCPTMAIEVVED
uniref:Ferredoxin n=1 Tax=uncultured bacterium esnapd15 TaxID=1366595 RepID=S5UBN3_9BACT|nr:ferredoxin [uncultured bacterium esnapd15]